MLNLVIAVALGLAIALGIHIAQFSWLAAIVPGVVGSIGAFILLGRRVQTRVWAVYAWCLSQSKNKDEALKVMGRAVEANPSDEKLKAGLTALQNDKRLKMKAYEPMWWQFGLEAPPQLMPPGGRQVKWARR